jgi:hypothetical protein
MGTHGFAAGNNPSLAKARSGHGKGCLNFPDLAEWPIKRRDCDSDASSKSKLWQGHSPKLDVHFEPFQLCTIQPPPTQNEISKVE